MSASEPVAELATALEQPLAPEGRLRDAFALLRANRVALLGLALTIVFALAGIAGAVIMLTPGLHHLWEAQDLTQALQGPSAANPLGTDQYGRDLLWRALGGVGIAFMIGVGVTALVLVIGLTLGSVAGYFGRKTDMAVTGLVDLTWGFPLLLVAVIVAGMIGKGLTALVVAVSVILWAGFARIVRAQVKTLAEREFVEAARLLGVPEWRILLRHMVPNVMGSVLVMASYYIAYTVIAEAGFSFINLGAQPPTPSLGAMVAEGRNYWSVSVWPAVVPGAAIALIVLGLNSVGDGLRDIFDPRLRRW